MFLEDKLIFNLTQAKQQPRKDRIGKSLTALDSFLKGSYYQRNGLISISTLSQSVLRIILDYAPEFKVS